jgi:outer membrane protein, multidrug efflux system
VTRRRPLVGVPLALVLGGCLLGPDYTRPPIPVPEAWREPAERSASLADLDWWQYFDDPVLLDLIQIALTESHDVRIAVVRVEQARASLVATNAARFPVVGGAASYSNQRLSAVTFPPFETSNVPTHLLEGQIHRISLDLAFELDLWGRLRRATEAARADLLSTEEARRTVRLTLVADVATAYVGLLQIDEELAISRRTVDSRREAVRILRARAREGIGSMLDLRRAEGELAAATNTVPDLERQARQIENALSVLLGRNPEAIPRGRPLTARTVPVDVPAGIPSELLDRRPDVRAAEQQLVAANARIGEAKAAYFPQIRLTGTAGLESSDLALLFTGPARVWNFLPVLTVPIFNAGRIAAGVDFAEAARAQALARYQQVIQVSFREVDDALIAHQKNREEIEEVQKQVIAYREVVRLAKLRYFNGIGSHLDVLDAERQLLGAEQLAARTLALQLVTLVQLYKALGGGWREPPTPPQS